MRFHDSPPVAKSKKLSAKLFGLYSDESIISHMRILKRYSLFCVYGKIDGKQLYAFVQERTESVIIKAIDKNIKDIFAAKIAQILSK